MQNIPFLFNLARFLSLVPFKFFVHDPVLNSLMGYRIPKVLEKDEKSLTLYPAGTTEHPAPPPSLKIGSLPREDRHNMLSLRVPALSRLPVGGVSLSRLFDRPDSTVATQNEM